MKTIIAGSRSIEDYFLVCEAVYLSSFEISEVVSGGAPGVDRLGEQWAAQNGVPFKQFLAVWGMYGKMAGKVRNRQMGDYSQALIAVWDGISRGTKHMIDYAREKELKVFIHRSR